MRQHHGASEAAAETTTLSLHGRFYEGGTSVWILLLEWNFFQLLSVYCASTTSFIEDWSHYILITTMRTRGYGKADALTLVGPSFSPCGNTESI